MARRWVATIVLVLMTGRAPVLGGVTVTVTDTAGLRRAVAGARGRGRRSASPPGPTRAGSRPEGSGASRAPRSRSGRPTRSARPCSGAASSGLHLSDVAHVELHRPDRGGGDRQRDQHRRRRLPRHARPTTSSCGGWSSGTSGRPATGTASSSPAWTTSGSRAAPSSGGATGARASTWWAATGARSPAAPSGTATRPGDNGVQAKGGSSEIVIRRCRFEHAGQRAVNLGGSTGPGLLPAPPAGLRGEGHHGRGLHLRRLDGAGGLRRRGRGGGAAQHDLPAEAVGPAASSRRTREPDFVPCRNGRFTDNLIAFRSDEMARADQRRPGHGPRDVHPGPQRLVLPGRPGPEPPEAADPRGRRGVRRRSPVPGRRGGRPATPAGWPREPCRGPGGWPSAPRRAVP